MIYVFDSGLGGLTALAKLRELAPRADIIYFGDTGRVPYGTRSRETLVKYAAQDMRFLMAAGSGCDAVLIACGTVSSNVMDELRGAFAVPFIGVVDGAAKKAAALTKNGVVGVIGTSATVRTDAFGRALRREDASIKVISRACPLLVSLVEYGFTGDGDPVTVGAAERYLAPMRDAGVDTVILGCTHFPIISDAISRVLPGVTLVNSGAEAAADAAKYARAGGGKVSYYVSDKADSFRETAETFLGHPLEGDVNVIDIEKY